MVEVVAVGRALGAPDAGERPVERVAEPVDDEQGARRPQPGAVAVGQHVGGGDARRGEHAERGEVVGHDALGQTFGDPREDARLGTGEQEALLARRGGG